MKKKILLLGNHDFVIYNFRKELIKELISKNYEVYISLPKGEKVSEMITWGCKYIETNIDRRGTNPFIDLKLILHYFKSIKKIKPNAVLSYTIKPNLYGGLVCRIMRIPYINNITGLGSGFNNGKVLKTILSILYKASLKRSNCVFFQNRQDMNILIDNGAINGKYRLIPGSGVNLEEYKFKELPNDGVINFLFIGRIMKDKGIDQFLEAAKEITKKNRNTKFNIVGFIEETQSHYEKIISDFEKNGYVSYLGYQSNVKPFIQMNHCLIQPSHGGEGLSNVLLESAATGRPLIASDIAGCRETINVNKNGYVFKAKSSDSLIENIEKFINLSFEDKKVMGIKSREKVKKEFDRKIVVNAYIEEIENICK